MSAIPMRKDMPEAEPGIRRESTQGDAGFFSAADSRAIPAHTQSAFTFYLNERRKGVTYQLYAVAAAMFRAWAKGRKEPYEDWARALNRPPSYASKLHEALHREPGRFLHLDYIAPFFENEEAETIWVEFQCELTRREPPIKKREITAEQDAAAEHEVIDELPEELREMICLRKAKKLGVRVEDLKR